MGRLANAKEGGATLVGIMIAENANVSKMYASQLTRNASSLSTESSEFEFDFHDEPPLSPKLLYSPNYIHKHFPDGESFVKAYTNQFCAERDFTSNHFPDKENVIKPSTDQLSSEQTYTHGEITSSTNANLGQNGLISLLPGAISEEEYGSPQIRGPLNYEQQGLRGKFEHICVDIQNGNDNYEVSVPGLRANHDVNGGRGGTNLRSLLNRRDLEQLPPLTNYNNHQKEINSALAISPSSSPLTHHANHSSNPCNFEDNHPDHAGAASPPENKTSEKKRRRKWAFKLDFLKKSPSPRSDQALVRRTSYDSRADYSLNHGISTIQQGCSGIAAAADEAGFDNYRHDWECNDAAATGEAGIYPNNQLSQRVDHYRAAAAASEAKFNRQINQINYAAAADHSANESRFNQQINQSIINYRVAPAVITKYESQSTYSVISAVSSPSRHADSEVIRAYQKKISRSTPISPAGSPPRSSHAASDQGVFTRGRPPMSPHALHYQQQKARAEELRRKTFLPYRQSLLGACFFPISTHPHHPQQAVY